MAGFDPFAIPPAPAPHDDTVSTLVPNVPAHPGRVSFSAVLRRSSSARWRCA